MFGKVFAVILVALAPAAEKSCSRVFQKVEKAAVSSSERTAFKFSEADSSRTIPGINHKLDRSNEPSFNTTSNTLIPTYGNDRVAGSKVILYFKESEQIIFSELINKAPPISIPDADRIIRKQLIKTISEDDRNLTSQVTFEALSGKLKINASKNFLGVQVSVGEINIYHVSLGLAGLVAACTGISEDF